MKKKSSISLGPGASSLILIFVVLSMMALGMLSLLSARNDLTLSERAAEVTEDVYKLQAQAEIKRTDIELLLIQAAATLQSDEDYLLAAADVLEDTEFTLEDNVISYSVSDGSRELDCALEILPLGQSQRVRYIRYNLSVITEDLWN